MQDLINSLTSKLGIDADTAKSAVGSLFSVIKKEGDSGAVGELFDKLPGANELAEEGGGDSGGGGLLGGLSGALGGLGGGAVSGLAGLVSSLGPDKLKDLATTVVDYARKIAGDDLVDKVVNSVPGLKSIL